MLHHVKCRRCRKHFNGKTGRSNLGNIVAFTITVLTIAITSLILLNSLRRL